MRPAQEGVYPLLRPDSDQAVVIRNGIAYPIARALLDLLPAPETTPDGDRPTITRATPRRRADRATAPATQPSPSAGRAPSGIAWADLRALWKGGRGLSIAELAARGACSDQAVYYHMKKEGWAADKAATPAPATKPGRPSRRVDPGESEEEVGRTPAYEGPVRRRCHNCSRITLTDPCQHCFEKAVHT